MNGLLLLAAAATAIAAVGHSVMGEQQILKPLLANADSQPYRSRVRLGWHLATIAWLGIALVFALAAYGPVDAGTHWSVRHLALALGVSAVVAFGVARGRNPAAYLFAIAAVAGWLAV